MQFKPNRRTATPTGSAVCGLHQPMSLGRNCVPLKPLAGSSSQTVPADVDEPVPPGLVTRRDGRPADDLIFLNWRVTGAGQNVLAEARAWLERQGIVPEPG